MSRQDVGEFPERNTHDCRDEREEGHFHGKERDQHERTEADGDGESDRKVATSLDRLSFAHLACLRAECQPVATGGEMLLFERKRLYLWQSYTSNSSASLCLSSSST